METNIRIAINEIKIKESSIKHLFTEQEICLGFCCPESQKTDGFICDGQAGFFSGRNVC